VSERGLVSAGWGGFGWRRRKGHHLNLWMACGWQRMAEQEGPGRGRGRGPTGPHLRPSWLRQKVEF
jgi:hypothetical protein